MLSGERRPRAAPERDSPPANPPYRRCLPGSAYTIPRLAGFWDDRPPTFALRSRDHGPGAVSRRSGKTSGTGSSAERSTHLEAKDSAIAPGVEDATVVVDPERVREGPVESLAERRPRRSVIAAPKDAA